MIFWIEGQFWSWKSSLATHIAYKVALFNAKNIAKNLVQSWNVVLSNIKMDSVAFPNYIYFEDDKFLEVLRTANLINDIERQLYTSPRKNSSLLDYKRSKFSKFYIFFDEAGAIANWRNYKEFDNVVSEYINQNRKNFQDIYLITADWEQTDKSLRRFVEYWYYVEPLFNFWIFRNFWKIMRCKKDKDGKIVLKPYLSKDEKGDYVTKTKPLIEYVSWFYKPNVWKYYDDLHKNIRDKDKYIGASPELLKKIVWYKQELLDLYNKDFRPLILEQDVEHFEQGSLPAQNLVPPPFLKRKIS